MRGGKLIALLVACCVLVGGTAGANKQDRGVQYMDVVALPDIDGDGNNDVLVVTSLTKAAATSEANSWIIVYLNNTNKKYWITVTVFRGGLKEGEWLNETLMATPVFYPSDEGVLGMAILVDGRLCLKLEKRYLLFNHIVFTEEQRKYIREKNGWLVHKPGDKF